MRRLLAPVRVAAVLVAVSLVAACSSDDQDDYQEKSVVYLYNTALNLLENKEYAEAAKAFDEVDLQHPYSLWATKAQLMSAFAWYSGDSLDDAVIAINRFIQLHPRSPDIPYAYYLRAICFYEQIVDVEREQQVTELARKALQDVVERFPDSTYARDAQFKLDLVRDQLAAKEMSVGRYYQKLKQYPAAIRRFRSVVDAFSATAHAPEALYRLAETYTIVGMHGEATKAAATLGYNYPDSQWYKYAYVLVGMGNKDPSSADGDRSWLSWLTDLL